MSHTPTRTLAALVAAPFFLVACTGPGAPPPSTPDAPAATTTAGASSPATTASPTPASSPGAPTDAAPLGVDPAVVEGVRALCAPGPGKTVEEFPDIEIAAVDAPGTNVPGRTQGSVEAPPIQVPPVRIPATVGEAGCVVTYDAPPGCLPKVEFSAAWLPGFRVEGYQVPQLDGTTVTVDGIEQDAEVVEGKVVEQKCQVVTEDAKRGVIRPGMIRTGAIRSGGIRTGHIRGGHQDGAESIPAATVPAMSVPAVSLPAQTVPALTLPYERLTDGVDAATSEDAATYEASESVLFEYNRSDLLPSANAALDAILADARAKGFDGAVRVEGHTDDTGPDDTNQTLSEARAQAVADYLTAHGVPAGDITATGRGESLPAHPNDTDENRAKNRRVVIEFAGR